MEGGGLHFTLRFCSVVLSEFNELYYCRAYKIGGGHFPQQYQFFFIIWFTFLLFILRTASL